MNPNLLLAIPMLPLLAALLAGLAGRWIGRAGSGYVAIAGVGLAALLSLYVLKQLVVDHVPDFDAPVYTWLVTDGLHIRVGFLIDRLSVLMMVVVSFVSLCVHVYTVGYMDDDPGYERFFAYIALFTFAMLMLVMSNNFLQLFFGWEGVGVVSYLLIGFWYTRPSAIEANLKAFLVNRVGDCGFVLGIAGVLFYTGSLDYRDAFAAAPALAGHSLTLLPGHPSSVLTLICLCLFIGAMAKSAQMPLHIWLAVSMEGPTPISALIHAATMVTAGIYMVARMSPLFEHSEAALSFVLVIGATTALFMGLVGVVKNDIKRVIAYSTLSQLGYMTVGLGVSAYSVAIFHLMTHAFFKALLFLAAGAVIIAMHHEQDMRKMGGLRRRMPVTYWTAMVASLALIGTPLFSGFYSKTALIDAVRHSHRAGAGYAYFCVVAGVLVTAYYTFRMMFMTFHGRERLDHHALEHFHDVGWNMKGPLVALAIPSLLVGFFTIGPLLFGNFFGSAIEVLPSHDILRAARAEFQGPAEWTLREFIDLPLLLAASGVLGAWFFVLKRPDLADRARQRLPWLFMLLVRKYYFDWFSKNVIVRGTRMVGNGLWHGGDQTVIDGTMVNGTVGVISRLSVLSRLLQSGFLYTSAFWMIIGLVVLLGWFLIRI